MIRTCIDRDTLNISGLTGTSRDASLNIIELPCLGWVPVQWRMYEGKKERRKEKQNRLEGNRVGKSCIYLTRKKLHDHS